MSDSCQTENLGVNLAFTFIRLSVGFNDHNLLYYLTKLWGRKSNIVCHTGIIGSNQLLTALIVARPGWIHIGKLPLHIVNGTRCIAVRVHLDSKTTASWSEENKFKYSEWFQLLSIFAYSYQNHQKMLSYLWQVEIPLLHRLVILFFFYFHMRCFVYEKL